MCCVVSLPGEQDDDDIVIEVHETKWWQKNFEVCLRNGVHNTLFKLLSLPLYCCIVTGPVDGRSDIVRGAILAARLATVFACIEPGMLVASYMVLS